MSFRKILLAFACPVLTGIVIWSLPRRPEIIKVVTAPPVHGAIMPSQAKTLDVSNVKIDSFQQSSCSPKVDLEFHGIRIAAAEEIRLAPPEPVFLLCGTYQFDEQTVEKYSSLKNEIVIVAVDTVTNQPYSCNMLRENFQPPPRARNRPPSTGVDSVTVRGYFNVNLFTFNPELPQQSATYHVYALLGEVKSNVVTVRVVAP